MGPESRIPGEGDFRADDRWLSGGPSDALHSPLDEFATICREFFIGWQRRNEWLRERWNLDAAAKEKPLVAEDLPSMDTKLLYLKREIGCLVAQDTSLFKQLFQLHEAMEELKEELDSESCCIPDDSSETSSISSEEELAKSPLAPSSNTFTSNSPIANAVHNSKIQQRRSLVHQTSFVRQRISYPPTSRNRYPRTTGRPNHQSQGSYDSGIHTPDQEIFV